MADASATELIFEEGFRRIVRGDGATLSGLIHEVENAELGSGTKVECHTYSLAVDGNGRPQVKELAKQLLFHVMDYAIPRRQVKEALEAQVATGSTAKIARLVHEARSLFVRSATSGEGGELLISLLAETRLGLPQVLCKMDLKTATQVHFHGSDGIHIGWNAVAQRLTLYWGESKLRPSFDTAIDACLSDLKKFLVSEGQSADSDQRDLQLVARRLDILDERLHKAVLDFFDPDNPNYKKYEVCGIGLVGFDGDCYPVSPVKFDEIIEATRFRLDKWHKSIVARIATHSLGHFSIHVICLPFPSVAEFRQALLQELGGV